MLISKLKKRWLNSLGFLKTVSSKFALTKRLVSFKQYHHQTLCNINPICAVKLATAFKARYSTRSPRVIGSQIPSDTKIAQLLDNAFFFDAYQIKVNQSSASALQWYLEAIKIIPRWINVLMMLRNQIVSFVGLKDLGLINDIDQQKSIDSYRIGDRIGIFSIYWLSEQEIILSDSDRHLHVKVSLCKVERNGESTIVLSTVVHVNNLLGRIYMFVIVPFHKLIVATVLKHLALSPLVGNFLASKDKK